MIERPRLFEALERPAKVTLVSAPAGSGKTSLVDAAADAFTNALGVGFLVAAACAVLGALAAGRWLPAHHRAKEANLVAVPAAA
jgi:ATP/maltotriose-dependent transcriptional regulator MalT